MSDEDDPVTKTMRETQEAKAAEAQHLRMQGQRFSASMVLILVFLVYPAACASSGVVSAHWQDKAGPNVLASSRLVGGFTPDEQRLYQLGIQHITNTHEHVGSYTIRQVVDQERVRENARIAIRKSLHDRTSATQQRARERSERQTLAVAKQYALWLVVSLGSVVVILLCVVAVRRHRSRKEQNRRRLEEERQYRAYSIRLANYKEALLLVESGKTAVVPLGDGEFVVYQDDAVLTWDKGTRDVPLGATVATTRGGAAGAVVGGLLLGPVGAVAGYAASNKTTVTSPGRVFRETENGNDRGSLTVTNKRVIFLGEIGNTIVEPLAAIIQITANETEQAEKALLLRDSMFLNLRYRDNEVRFRRTNALPNERFYVRNFAYFALAMHRAGRGEIIPPQRPALPQ